MTALKAQGVPSLYLADQPYRLAEPEKLRAEIGAFIAAL